MDSNQRSASVYEFLKMIFEDWTTAMVGTLTLPFTAIAAFSDSSWQKALWASTAVSAACYTTYTVWARERSKIGALESETSSLKLALDKAHQENSSELVCKFGQLVHGTVLIDSNQYTSVCVNVSMMNRGVQSGFHDWSLSFTIDGAEIPAMIWFPNTISLAVDQDKVLRITPFDMIAKTSVNPISKGGILTGWIIALLPELVEQVHLSHPKTTFNLGCFDAYGRSYEFRGISFGERTNNVYVLPDINSKVGMRPRAYVAGAT